MLTVESIDDCRAAVRVMKQANLTIGFVPTMGALHEGHVSLVRASKARCGATVVSIFVNPTQFGPGEDLNAYPRTLESDLAACEKVGVDVVFVPNAASMYSTEACTTVRVARLTEGLCGPFRPGHFDGVATVVMKLFQIVQPHAAYFGEKDYQQLMVIQRMVADLNVPIEIVGCPTVRESDGLAMSSRNAYLSPEDRVRAAVLSRALVTAQADIKVGRNSVVDVVEKIRRTLVEAGLTTIDYIEVVDARSLLPLKMINSPAQICIAARIGKTRLIDNIGVDAPQRRG